MSTKGVFWLIASVLVVSCTRDSPPSLTLAPEQVTIDSQEMAARFSGKVVQAARNKPHSPPFMNGAPKHLRFAFHNEQLSKFINYRERQLLVYPIEAYRELFRDAPAEQAKFDEEITRLKWLIANSSEGAISRIPVLPPVETIQLFCSQIHYLTFEGGTGVRFITRYTMEASPTTNEHIFYTFQGLTSDGRYFIAAFFPVTVKDLPETAIKLTTLNFLNQLDPADFTPDLARMDAMIESLRLAEPLPANGTPQTTALIAER